ncbi:hypothetical protein B0F90DRAFT_1681131 [Multifurca ochricompacta]|uniref:Uncharacterized protein n=1 Tax=Multifurca ochricompacta TaxID=376703 RepID=A0AAD4MDL8_9AGAM|nr:hypothetical protein B0F90DRAFT_1681131 [Multifurca ochricompacta]
MLYAGNQYNGAAGYAAQHTYGYPGQYYSQQPQPIQHQYSGQQQQYASTPYAGTVPFPQPSPYTSPPALQPVQSQPPTHRPPRTQTPHPHRRHTSSGATNNGHAKPLRSAIKKAERSHSTSANGVNPVSASLSRTRTHSGAAENRPRLNSISRTRTNSSSRVDPDHVFLSINPPNGLELSNLAFQNTVEELREHIFPMWPSGVAHQVRHGHDWRVRFAGSPWDSKGHESIMAQRMICRIFWVLAAQGYVYLTSINTGRALKSPRLVSLLCDVLNNAGDRVTFVDPPAAVANSLGLSLRAAFPHRIANEQTSEDGIFTIILKSGINGMGADKNLFLAHILKYINDMAFKLDASVPLARRGLFGLNGRKELWVFKGSESWWSPNRK